MSMIEVFTTEYQFNHGSQPRGVGLWAFRIGTTKPIFWSPFHMTYTEARKLALAEAAKRGTSFVVVLP